MNTALWLGMAFGLGLAASRLGLPSLVGFLVAGFALNLAGAERTPLLQEIAHTGVMLLLFTVGLKLRLRQLLRREVWGGGLLHLAITVAVLAPALYILGGLSPMPALLLSVALGFSSTVVAAKALEAKGELRAFHGRTAIGILIVQDVVAVAALAIGGAGAPSPLALLLLLLPLVRPLLYRLLSYTGHDELLVLFGLLLALVAGGLGFHALGLSAELGALVVGALLADHPRAKEVSDALWGLKEVFLVGFFLNIGMAGTLDLASVLISLVLLALLPLKAALFFWIFVRLRLRGRSAFLAAASLASYSEFGLIVADLMHERGWVGDQALVVFALTVAVSFVIAAQLNVRAHPLYQRFDERLSALESNLPHPDEAPVSLGTARVLISGMGRVGGAAYDFLRSRGEDVIGIDSDPTKVESQQAQGRRVVYADAEDPGFWRHVDLNGVRAVLLATPDAESKRVAARLLRQRGYEGLISATNLYPEEGDSIVAAGADTTFNYFTEVGVGFAEHTWETLNPRPQEETS